jgi:dipeptidyl aminopeptidase/acylaminoacyl peptidase
MNTSRTHPSRHPQAMFLYLGSILCVLFFVSPTIQLFHSLLVAYHCRNLSSIQDRASGSLKITYPVMRSPDGGLLLIKSLAGSQYELDIFRGRDRIAHVIRDSNPLGLAWSPDGKFVAFLDDHLMDGKFQLNLWAIQSRDPQEQNEKEILNASFPLRWSPDGKYLLFANGRSGIADLEMVSVQDGRFGGALSLAKIDPDADYPWSPAGQEIAYVSSDARSRITTMPLRTLLPISTIFIGNGEIRELSWSKDGSKILFSYRDAGEQNFSMGFASPGTSTRILCPSLEADVVDPRYLSTTQIIAIVRSSAEDRLVEFRDCAEVRSIETFHAVHLSQIDPNSHRYDLFARINGAPSDILSLGDREGDTLTTVSQGQITGVASGDFSVIPRKVSVMSGGGAIQCWVWEPRPGAAVKGAVLWLHGGPHLYVGAEWDAMYEEMARRDFVVLVPNYPGSTTFGKDFERVNSLPAQTRAAIDVASWAIQEWPTAATNITLAGSSYGTRIISSALKQRPTMFQKAVYVSPIITAEADPLSFTGEVAIFHGSRDQITSTWRMLWMFGRLLRSRPIVDSKLKYYLVQGEGHGFSALRSQLAVADEATAH